MVLEGYYRVCRRSVKYSFVVAPKHLRVVFERCFDLSKVHFISSISLRNAWRCAALTISTTAILQHLMPEMAEGALALGSDH